MWFRQTQQIQRKKCFWLQSKARTQERDFFFFFFNQSIKLSTSVKAKAENIPEMKGRKSSACSIDIFQRGGREGLSSAEQGTALMSTGGCSCFDPVVNASQNWQGSCDSSGCVYTSRVAYMIPAIAPSTKLTGLKNKAQGEGG